MIRVLLAAALLPVSAAAQVPAGNSAPQPVPVVDAIPTPRDIAYPGTIRVDIDATDTARGIFRVREAIPVAAAGPMVLLYPQWLPGTHAPLGEIEKLAGLVIRADGRVIPWTRDPVDVFAFHLDVPAGAKQLDLEFQFLSATKADQGRVVMTPAMLSLQPNLLSLYPAGYFTRGIPVRMSVRYPAGWTASGAIPARQANGVSTYDQTNYEVLVDSPILAGKYGRTFPLTPRVDLAVYADDPAELAATPDQIAAHRRLVEQAVKAFGSRHYDHYTFLLSISDRLGGIGLEHHRSSENGLPPGYFVKWADGPGRRNLLPHEFSHSWDGKFRRGADLWTPTFREPMLGSLLWVYEGQTQFWGFVLQARSGIVSKQDTLDRYALIAATYDTQPARAWRDLLDTTTDPVVSARRPKAWTSWQRSEDYYNEGLLVWMDVDSLLREKSRGAKSIDDFAQRFFGVRDGDWGELTYTLGDVAATLNAVVAWDWQAYLTRRLREHAAGAPLDGFVRNGYRLVYTAEPTPAFNNNEATRKIVDLSFSGGLIVGNDDGNKGELTEVTWGSAAFDAGLTVGTTIVAVDTRPYSPERLRAAIAAAAATKTPIVLLVKSGDTYRTAMLDTHGGLRYPRLQRIGAGEAGLDRLLAPR